MLPEAISAELQALGLPEDEVGLREALDARVPGWNLFKQTPAAAKRWKCRYRLMMGGGIFDGQSAVECYARALLATYAARGPEMDANAEEA